MAWFDLALFLIERYVGLEVASETARAFVFDRGRASQVAYGRISSKSIIRMKPSYRCRSFLNDTYAACPSLDEVAHQFNLSPRTFKRRFKQATGSNAQHYLQTCGFDAAKRLLASCQITLQRLVQTVGYDDISSFGLFKRETGLTPGAYRSRFQTQKVPVDPVGRRTKLAAIQRR